jgi:hypothetical protein
MHHARVRLVTTHSYQNDIVAVVASRASPTSKPPYSVKRRRWEGLEEKDNGGIAGVEGEAR